MHINTNINILGVYHWLCLEAMQIIPVQLLYIETKIVHLNNLLPHLLIYHFKTNPLNYLTLIMPYVIKTLMNNAAIRIGKWWRTTKQLQERKVLNNGTGLTNCLQLSFCLAFLVFIWYWSYISEHVHSFLNNL